MVSEFCHPGPCSMNLPPARRVKCIMTIGLCYDTGQIEMCDYRGAPIRVSPAFFVVAGALAFPFWRMVSLSGLLLTLIFIAVAFASILLHELAHAWVAGRFASRPSASTST